MLESSWDSLQNLNRVRDLPFTRMTPPSSEQPGGDGEYDDDECISSNGDEEKSASSMRVLVSEVLESPLDQVKDSKTCYTEGSIEGRRMEMFEAINDYFVGGSAGTVRILIESLSLRV